MFFIWLLMISTQLYSQFQVVHDAPNTATSPFIAPLIFDDGAILTYQGTGDDHLFRKYDPSGLLLWSKAYSGASSNGWGSGPVKALALDENDGFVLLRYVTLIWTDTANGEWHQDVFNLARFNNNGDLLSSYNIKKSFFTYNFGEYFERLQLDIAPNNDAILMIMRGSSPIGHIEVHRIDPNGELLWSRSVGQLLQPLPDHPDPTTTFDQYPHCKFTVAPDGSIYYMEGGRSLGQLRLGKLAGNGDLLWMNRYVYGNTVNSIDYDGLQIGPDGNINASGRLETTVGSFHIFMTIDPDGTLLNTDIYRTPYHLTPIDLCIDDEGKRYHLVRTHFVHPEYSHGLLIADTLGSHAIFKRRADQIVLPNNVFLPLHHMDLSGDQLAISGLLHHEHVDLAFTTRYETLLSFDTGDITSCFLNDTAFAHIPVPLSIIATEEMTDAGSVDISQFFTSSDSTMSLQLLDPEPLVPLCEFGSDLLGIELGIGDVLYDQLPMVQQTLLSPGDPIRIIGAASVFAEVWDASGKLIHGMGIPNGTGIIPTNGWHSGIYLVRAIDRYNNTRAERIMIQ